MLFSGVNRDYLITLTVNMSITACSIVMFWLALELHGDQGFSEYSFLKRITAFLVPAMILGLGVGVPREVAAISETEFRDSISEILRGAFFAVGMHEVLNVLQAFLFGNESPDKIEDALANGTGNVQE